MADTQTPTDHEEGDSGDNRGRGGILPDNAWEAYQLDVAEESAASPSASAHAPSDEEEEAVPSEGEEESEHDNMSGMPAADAADVPELPAGAIDFERKGPSHKERWERSMQRLREFKAKYGHANVSRTHDKGLGRFVTRQRENYRKLLQGKKSVLTVDKIQELERLGFQWATRPGTIATLLAEGAGDEMGGSRSDKMLLRLKNNEPIWNERFEQLRTFREQSGHFRVPYTVKRGTKRPRSNGEIEDLDPETVKLGKWVKRQRRQHQQKKMPEERVAALEELGFDFTPGVGPTKEERLEEQLGLLDQLRKRREFSNAQVQDLNFLYDQWKCSAGNAVAKPIQFLACKKETNKFDARWHQKFEQLKQYRAVNGHTRVKQNSSDIPLKSLGKWVESQRQSYWKRQKGEDVSLNEERILLLESIGFEWRLRHRLPLKTMEFSEIATMKNDGEKTCEEDLPFDLSSVFPELEPNAMVGEGKWDSHLLELVRYKRLFDSTTVNSDEHPVYGDRLKILSEWVDKQRSQYKKWKNKEKGGLSKSRIKRLEEIGFEFDLSDKATSSWDQRWDAKVDEMRLFRQMHGHCRVKFRKKKGQNDPNHDPERNKLAKWVERQRHSYAERAKGKKTTLTDERVAVLNALGMEWRVVISNRDDVYATFAASNQSHDPMGYPVGRKTEEESDSDSGGEAELSVAHQVIDSIPDSIPNIAHASVDVDDGSMAEV